MTQTLTIDVKRALRDPDYRTWLSRELEGGVTDIIMDGAADRIDALERALEDAFYEGFILAAAMTPRVNDILTHSGRAWEHSKARAALTPSERKDG